ncbi:Holliday junction branch migration protein RuvA [Christensenella tenuis]|jgi:holliday junction DNA helicase RuvA|uniref:Holliday junction branch migration complex subunit RuvA n=1 Tax=Christensenella tenuis TaxID=2763033 RepID=A0ABR7EDX9_9FIRM|nr:Holliday junction branch migration protein RuvA [Christensenella tenuis]MBC5647981.1 Holliday junction branch migration protein RuvA [Christensenella tenuis]
MYAYIAGEVVQKAATYAVIDVGGVGYQIFTDTFSLNAIKTGEKAKLYTYLKVAEDDMTLYGFMTQEQKTMFEKLLSISGIGPKAAASVLSVMRVNDIAAAVISNDDKAFTNVPGIGKKTAQRLVLELKEKVDFEDAVGMDMDMTELSQDAAAEAAAALTGLGYNRQEAVAAIAAVRSLGDTAEELVSLALKRMGK